MPNSWTANQKEISLESDFAVTKDKVVEVCAGIMTNASLALGGGSANSDFSSDRFAKTYTQEITLSK
jgi:hypothetical protein